VESIIKMPLFKLRTISDSIHARLGIIDKKEAFIATNPRTSAVGSSMLWTNNFSILIVFQDYFENLWIRTKETPI
jgi:hypothetical protein